MYIQKQTHRKAIPQDVSFWKAPDLPPPPTPVPTPPPHPGLCVAQSRHCWFSELKALERIRAGVPCKKGGSLETPRAASARGGAGCGGWGGGPDRLMRTPNAPQPGPLIASRLAGSEPGPPPGSINSPSLQMAAGSSLASRFTGDWGVGSRWRTPTPPHWGKEAPAAAPPCCPVRDTGPEGAAEVEPIAWRRETEAQKGQGTVQGRW